MGKILSTQSELENKWNKSEANSGVFLLLLLKSVFLKRFFLFFKCIWVCVVVVQTEPSQASDGLELEFQVIVTQHEFWEMHPDPL